jgi:hypothetical protein
MKAIGATTGNITTIIDQHEKQQPTSQKRLKGLLALLPESGTLYHGQRKHNNSDHNWDLGLNSIATKITSRKQQRRFIKRYHQNELRLASNRIDVECGNCNYDTNDSDQNVAMPTKIDTTPIHLADLLHDDDIAVLFLFDPFQPYSLQLLRKLLSVCRCSSDSQIPIDETGTFADSVIDDVNTHHQSKIHCLVVTPCSDTILIAGLLENTDAVLLPWTNSNGGGPPSEYWKIAMGGANLCPSILAIVECSKGRNVFPINHEELALDWNSSIDVYIAWRLRRTSAFTTIQRIQSYALYPTSSICIVQ